MLTETVVGFHVAHSVTMSSGSKIPFNTIKTNLGNAWNKNNHTFTAPVKGLYLFSLRITTDYSSSSGIADARIMSGDKAIRVANVVYAHRSSSAYIPDTAPVTVILNAGEQVYAKRIAGTFFSNSNLFTHFVGYLIGKVK